MYSQYILLAIKSKNPKQTENDLIDFVFDARAVVSKLWVYMSIYTQRGVINYEINVLGVQSDYRNHLWIGNGYI